MQRRVLITGASGFLGTHLGNHFQKFGWFVVGIDRKAPKQDSYIAKKHLDQEFFGDISDEVFLKSIFEANRFDLCVHLAGPANVSYSIEHPAEDFRANTLPLLNLLETQRRLDCRVKTLLVSSAAVYGNPTRLPVLESDRIAPLSPYGFGKWHQEMLATQYCGLHQIPVCCARVFSTFGPGLRSLAVWEIAKRAMAGVPLVYGVGDETRDFLYVADVAKALAHICTCADFSGEIFNVASGRETSIRELAGEIFKAVGLLAEPQFSLSGELGKPKRWCANVDKLTALGFSSDFSLESGLSQTVAWVRKNA